MIENVNKIIDAQRIENISNMCRLSIAGSLVAYVYYHVTHVYVTINVSVSRECLEKLFLK